MLETVVGGHAAAFSVIVGVVFTSFPIFSDGAVPIFGWKRRCADVRAGTQAPPLRFRLGGLRVERLMPFWGLHVNGSFVCMGLRGKI